LIAAVLGGFALVALFLYLRPNTNPGARRRMPSVCGQFALVVILTLSQSSQLLSAQANTTARGVEFAAAVNHTAKDMKVEGNLYLPRGIVRVRAVLVVINFGLGARAIYHDPEWLKFSETLGLALLHVKLSNISLDSTAPVWNEASLGGGEGLVILLKRLAQESGHMELENAPLVFWGHSAAGPFGATLALLYPQRTLAFVRYHSGARPLEANMTVLSQIPALAFVGGKIPSALSAPSVWPPGINIAREKAASATANFGGGSRTRQLRLRGGKNFVGVDAPSADKHDEAYVLVGHATGRPRRSPEGAQAAFAINTAC
jgi:hypothetical protein